MKSLNLKQCYNTNNSSLSRKKAVYLMPITLAFATSFFTLWHLSFFSHTFSSLSLLSHKSSDYVKIISFPQNKSSQNHFTLLDHDGEKFHAKSSRSRGGGGGVQVQGRPPSFKTIGSRPSKHINQDVLHDKQIFHQNYEEMKRSLKVFIYPHNKNDPFASSLLPQDSNQELEGNYASEAYFKNVLYKSHFITKDPYEADLFFLPFSIARLRHDRRIGVAGLSDFIRDYMRNISHDYPYWNQTGGADHFYVACHSIGKVAMEKVEQVKSNAIQVICSSSYFLTNYFAHKDVSLPQIWPRHDEPLDLANISKRKKLAFFAGTIMSSVRKSLIQTWENDSTIFANSGRLKTPYSDELLGSKYCLHAKGFEVNTARVGDSLYYGCVPVILADYYDLPFMDILNWRAFSVVVLASDIPNLKKILQKISPKEYSVLQANVLKVRRHFQWHKSPVEFDAFYMVMYELWLRRSSVRVLLS